MQDHYRFLHWKPGCRDHGIRAHSCRVSIGNTAIVPTLPTWAGAARRYCAEFSFCASTPTRTGEEGEGVLVLLSKLCKLSRYVAVFLARIGTDSTARRGFYFAPRFASLRLNNFKMARYGANRTTEYTWR